MFSFLLAIIIFKISKDKRIFSIVVLSISSFVIYLLLLLINYVCFFSEYESVNLASYERYVSTYLLFLIVLIIVSLIKNISKTSNILIIIAVFMLIFNSNIGLFQITIGPLYNKKNSMLKHNVFENKADYIKKYIEPNDKVTIVSFGNEGYNHMRITYHLGPMYSSNYYLIEPVVHGNDGYDGYYETIIKPKDYVLRLKDNNVKYVYLDNINDKFIEEYKELFYSVDFIKNDSLFLINSENKLEKIGE